MTSPQLFDFDREVEPVLEVLVGKTIEQSLEEVMEEEELARLKAQQRAFEELRNNELAEVQRLQEQERRRREEKVRSLEKVKVSPGLVKCANPQETALKKKKRKKSLRQMAPFQSWRFIPELKGLSKNHMNATGSKFRPRVFIFTSVAPFCVEMVLLMTCYFPGHRLRRGCFFSTVCVRLKGATFSEIGRK